MNFDKGQFEGKMIRFLDDQALEQVPLNDVKCPLCEAGHRPAFKPNEELVPALLLESESALPQMVKMPKALADKFLKLMDIINRKFNVVLMCGDAVQCVELTGTSEEAIRQRVACEYAGFRVLKITEVL